MGDGRAGPEKLPESRCNVGEVFCGKNGGVTTGGDDGVPKGEAAGNILTAAILFCRKQARSNSLAKARTVGKRCCGSFCSAVITTCSISAGIVGRYRRKDGGGLRECWTAISVNVP